MIKLFDTFSGVGGFHLALEESIGKENVECVGFSEIDKFSKSVYQYNFPGVKDFGDITQIDIANLPDFDVLTGGFPCQDVSVAGKQNLEGGRTVLVEYLLQILEIKKPRYFVFENVKGLLSKKFDEFSESIFERIRSAGYCLDYEILNTKDFGLPQNRQRVFMVGRKGVWQSFEYKFPEKQELKIFLKDILEKEVDEKYYMTQKQFNNLNYENLKRIYEHITPTLDTMQGGHRQPKIITNVNPSGKGINGNVYRIDTESPTLTTNKGEGIKIIERGHGFFKGTIGERKIIGTIRSQIQGNTLIIDPRQSDLRLYDGFVPILRSSKHGLMCVNNGYIRKITPTECERLQGFPDNWTSICSNSQRYKQMGNAISVPVVKAIFDNLF